MSFRTNTLTTLTLALTVSAGTLTAQRGGAAGGAAGAGGAATPPTTPPTTTAQPPAGRGAGRAGGGGGGRGVVVERPKDMRVPPPFNAATMVRPIAMADNVWMSELTILEMRDLVQKYGYKTAIIANGTMESNGPYLPTGKHNLVLRVTADAIARTLGNTLVAPLVMLDGGNPETTRQPGRLVLSNPTLTLVLKDMATSLKAQGFTEIFFIGDSGSNTGMLSTVARELTAAWNTKRAADSVAMLKDTVSRTPLGPPVLVAHIPEYYNYGDVLKYQNEVLGMVELNKDLDGYHDDYYISSIILQGGKQHVRYDERVKVGLDQINSLPFRLEEAMIIGKKLTQFRADATVAAIEKLRAANRGGAPAGRGGRGGR